MITRERLSKSEYGRGLLALYERLIPFHVKDWGNNDSDDKGSNRPSDREAVADVDEANVITSLHQPSLGQDREPRHAVVLDIDHPAWLIPSTTPGHYHLYIDVPGGLSESAYFFLLKVLAANKIIEKGYAAASTERGFTSVRLPWVQKEKGPTQHD